MAQSHVSTVLHSHIVCRSLVSHCFLCFQFAGITAQVMATVIVAPSCVSVRVSGCRIFSKFTLALKRAIVVRLFVVFCL